RDWSSDVCSSDLGLIGEQVRDNASAREFGNHLGRVPDQPDRDRLLLPDGVLQDADGLVEVVHANVAIAGADAPLDLFTVDFNAEEGCAVEGGGQGLSSAHAA